MSIFLVNYISLLSSSQTPVHPYTRTPNSVLKFCAIILIIKLSCVLTTIFSLCFTGCYYLPCTAQWLLLSAMHSAVAAIICHAHRSGCYYLPCTPKWLLLSAMHTEVAAIICLLSTTRLSQILHWFLLYFHPRAYNFSQAQNSDCLQNKSMKTHCIL